MLPLVSILIPAFNAERWIADTIQSALGQTWERKEIIVVDDGSTDQTLSIAQQFASRGVIAVTQKNAGASAARNKAFALSHGEYIQWLDADDLLAPDKIARQLEAPGASRSQMTLRSSAWGHFIYRPAKARFVPTPLWCDLTSTEWLLRKLEQNLFMQPATWLVSRELTEAAGPWDVRLSLDDDGEYFCRVVLASDGIQFVPAARVFYRRSPNSLSYIGRSNKKMESQFLSLKLQFARIRSLEDSPRLRAACLQCWQDHLIWFHPERPDLVAQLKQMAVDFGGQLVSPQLPWKYVWIQKAFGWAAAKRTQVCYNESKSSVLRCWDHALFRLGI